MDRQPFIQPAALADMEAAGAWYDERDLSGVLRARLIGEIEELLQLLCVTPTIFAEYQGSVRRALLRRFPYAVYYEHDSDRVVVVAFMHMRREPM